MNWTIVSGSWDTEGVVEFWWERSNMQAQRWRMK
jgi:hypothetical protein